MRKVKRTSMKQAFILCLTLAVNTSAAQSSWTMQQCMQYAVEHNHEVKRAELQLDNYKATKKGAIGNFLPMLSANIGAQYNFGRAIDPETNGYTDVSTFYNGYTLQASLPVFDGFSRIHALQAAKASTMMGLSTLRQMQNQTAERHAGLYECRLLCRIGKNGRRESARDRTAAPSDPTI